MICEKCGKEWPDTLKQPIRCMCTPIVQDLNTIKRFTRPDNQKRIADVKREYAEMQIKIFHDLWKSLHTYKYTTEKEANEWFYRWCSRIPCGSCKQDWAKIIGEFPPDFSSSEAFFIWGVDAHNLVNKKLDKPQITLEDARKTWQ